MCPLYVCILNLKDIIFVFTALSSLPGPARSGSVVYLVQNISLFSHKEVILPGQKVKVPRLEMISLG